ncbi:hypothetical protein BHE74_00016414 [Ensete ventricosum]|nr:hypothetical protein BHE74_00016414 [Ensete ventricosum]
MGSMDRSKKRNQLWKKALVHFALCFVMGFFTGFAPHSTATLFSHRRADRQPVTGIGFLPAAPVEQVVEPDGEAVNRSLIEIPRSAVAAAVAPGADNDDPPPPAEGSVEAQPPSRRLLIIVTTTRADDRFQGALLLRLAHTLRLVPPPLLWVVVQAYAEAPATAAMLRTTGLMYRHLTFKENFTDPAAEADHQRNVALSHVEYHRLTGIVHFAGASNAYDLRFFDEIREIEKETSGAVLDASRPRRIPSRFPAAFPLTAARPTSNTGFRRETSRDGTRTPVTTIDRLRGAPDPRRVPHVAVSVGPATPAPARD